jgi:hypothetical protein
MPLYRVEVQIGATAYIKAKDVKEATKKAKTLKDNAIYVETAHDGDVSDVEISGLQFDNPDLPDISLSPAMTIHGMWPGDFPHPADD